MNGVGFGDPVLGKRKREVLDDGYNAQDLERLHNLFQSATKYAADGYINDVQLLQARQLYRKLCTVKHDDPTIKEMDLHFAPGAWVSQRLEGYRQ